MMNFPFSSSDRALLQAGRTNAPYRAHCQASVRSVRHCSQKKKPHGLITSVSSSCKQSREPSAPSEPLSVPVLPASARHSQPQPLRSHCPARQWHDGQLKRVFVESGRVVQALGWIVWAPGPASKLWLRRPSPHTEHTMPFPEAPPRLLPPPSDVCPRNTSCKIPGNVHEQRDRDHCRREEYRQHVRICKVYDL